MNVCVKEEHLRLPPPPTKRTMKALINRGCKDGCNSPQELPSGPILSKGQARPTPSSSYLPAPGLCYALHSFLVRAEMELGEHKALFGLEMQHKSASFLFYLSKFCQGSPVLIHRA